MDKCVLAPLRAPALRAPVFYGSLPDKKERKKFLYKEIHMGSGAKSYCI
jgi:hypothetical protein